MLVKYWKNFKWFLFIPLIAFVFIFKINNVSALVFKGNQDIATTNSHSSGTLGSGLNWVGTMTFNNHFIPSNYNYDYIGIRFNKINFVTTNSYNIDNPALNGIPTSFSFYCYNSSSGVCINADILSSGSSSIPNSLYGSFNEGDITVSANMYTNSNAVPCWFDNSLGDNMAICPIIDSFDYYSHFELVVAYNGYESVSYNIEYSNVKFFFNNDNTELNIQQQQTNTNLQYIYQYQQNDSVSGSTTQATSDFSDLAQSFNSELAGVNDLSQLVLLPISLFMDLSTDNCQPLHLVVPFVNTSVDLPCMKTIFNAYFYGFYTIFTTIMSAIICYWVAIKTGSLIKDIVDCDNDRIEVIEL